MQSSVDAQHLRPGTPCTSVSSTPTSTSDEQIPELVPDKPLQQLHLPLKTSSDEEADREVEAICATKRTLQGKISFTSQASLSYV